ncbi:MAG: DNA repair protein RadA [Candidatus Saccharimonadales bacterium]|nr:DNA repair protein RadA [Candidatus Saccharimonadales bacterium]
MAKKTVQYICQSCGSAHPKWAGRCEVCGEWNSLTENVVAVTGRMTKAKTQVLKPQKLIDVKPLAQKNRLITGIDDVDVVLGGGIIPGSINLITGEPGIGKSTLIMQIANNISKDKSVLYVSGEESADQIRMRAQRLDAESRTIDIVTSTSTDDVAATVSSGQYELVIVDSIQTMATDLIASSPGSVSQITNSTQLLITAAKESKTALLVVGHVTKQGNIAGPKLLEHLVDVVLNLEGDRYGGFKVLRSIKNRYGSTNEAGIFEMKNNGLIPINNPSAALLAERQISDGSVVLATMEGSRPLLVEVQALVNPTAFGYPKRTASGIDLNRLNLLIAMLSRRTKLKLDDKDVYVNVVGGLKIQEPAADLAVCMAIASAAKGMSLKKDAVVFGEVGLSGEVRHVGQVEKRLAEAKKMGFNSAIGPKSKSKSKSLNTVSNVREALNSFLG